MIKQMVRMLFSVILGKEYQLTELPDENKYEVSGKPLEEYLRMVDAGSVNEAENAILEGMDYGNKNEIAALVRFYEYIGEKEDSFLEEHGYSKEEAMDGLKQMAEECGYGNMLEFFLK